MRSTVNFLAGMVSSDNGTGVPSTLATKTQRINYGDQSIVVSGTLYILKLSKFSLLVMNTGIACSYVFDVKKICINVYNGNNRNCPASGYEVKGGISDSVDSSRA